MAAVPQLPVTPQAPPFTGPVLAPKKLVHKPRGKWIALAAVLVIAAVAAAWLLLRSPAAPGWITAPVDRGDIEATVTTSGSLNAVITVQVGSQVSGNIIALYADFNTKVKKGQLVAEIDPAPFKAAVEQATATWNAAKAAVLTARSSLAKSQSDLATAEANVAAQQANLEKTQSAVELARVQDERRQVMVKSGSTSQEDADTAHAGYEQAVASVNAAQAEAVVAQTKAALDQAQLNLTHTRILAPVDGTVESRNMDVGQTVAASFQAPVIFLIAQDLTKMQVDTNVDEADVGAIRVDQPASFVVDAYPGQTFKGRVSQIRQAPINVQNVITYDVVVEVSNPELKLFPGMTANVTIATGHAANVLRIPKAALRFRPRGAKVSAGASSSKTVVYVPGAKGEARAIPVVTGLADANRVELKGGDLIEGQPLITGAVSTAGSTPAPSQSGGGSRRLGI